MPLPSMMAKVIGRMWKKAQDAGAAPEMKDFLLLAYDPSPWKSELYMNVTKEVPGAENVKLTGTFVSKVFDGPYNHVPKYLNEFRRYLELKRKRQRNITSTLLPVRNVQKNTGIITLLHLQKSDILHFIRS